MRLYKDVFWENGVFYSRFSFFPNDPLSNVFERYWDPKGNSYYDRAPEFRTIGGVETAEAEEHFVKLGSRCRKLRYSTGRLSPRFHLSEMFFNKFILIARDYFVVKHDKNRVYHICGFMDDTVIVQKDDYSGYQQFFLDGKKGESFKSLPSGLKRITPISYIFYQNELKLDKWQP